MSTAAKRQEWSARFALIDRIGLAEGEALLRHEGHRRSTALLALPDHELRARAELAYSFLINQGIIGSPFRYDSYRLRIRSASL